MTSAKDEQRERRNVLRGGGPADNRRTYLAFGESEASAPRGRFAAETKAAVTGTEIPQYPKQPPGTPWASDPVGTEPPLGIAIDAQEPVGTAVEIEQSLQALGEVEGPPSLGQLDGGGGRSETVPPSRFVDAPSPSPTKRKPRDK